MTVRAVRPPRRAKVVSVSLEQPFEPIAVEEGYRKVLLVVRRREAVIGELWLPALPTIPQGLLADVIAERLGERIWHEELTETVRQAFGLDPVPPPIENRYTVSAIVCTRDRPDELARCLASLLALNPPAHEIIVVDNAPSDDRTEALCAELPVRYVREPHPGAARARNRGVAEARGELVAFTDDDCVVDPAWLRGLSQPFADPLVMAVTGYVGPLELETEAQYLFEAHGGFRRGLERRLLDGARGSAFTRTGAAGASANCIFRRTLFAEIGLFAEELGPGTPARSGEDTDLFARTLAAGYRIAFDPSRVVWHRHRADLGGLRTILFDYTVSFFALAAKWLLERRDLSALRACAWWWLHHFPRDLRLLLRGDDRAVPSRVLLAEMAGALLGPWRLLRSRAGRRRLPPIELPRSAAPAPPPRLAVREEDPPLAVVLPSRNRRDMLAAVLEGLAGQTYPSDRFEVVLVLDGSTDASAAMARALEVPYPLRIIEQERCGVAASRNRAAREAQAPVLVFLDDDIVPDPGLLAAHARAHRLAPRPQVTVGYCPPVIRRPTFWAHELRAWWEDHYRLLGQPNHRWMFIDYGSGNSSLPRSLFLDVGGFDDRFRGRREDWELALRLLAAGALFAYEPAAVGKHHLDTTFDRALRDRRQEARDDVLLAQLHPRVQARLPLAHLARWRPRTSERRLRREVRVLALLETFGLRGRWRARAARTLQAAYALGLADAFPSWSDYLAFAGPIWQQSVDIVPVELAGHGLPPLPADAGSIELAVKRGLEPVGPVIAVDAGEQWDWETVTRRVVITTGSRVQALAVAEWLERGAASKRLEGVADRRIGHAC